jgi:mono/diheme cytochrome c family protein
MSALRRRLPFALALALLAAGCDIRMRDQPSLMPNDKPNLSVPAGAEPVTAGEPARTLAEAAALRSPFADAKERPVADLERGEVAYRRFCRHCHGDGGRSWTIVGASLDPAPGDLLQAVRDKSDGELYGVITFGSKTSPALGPHIDPLDRWRIVLYLRTLPDAAAGRTPVWAQ